MKSQLSKFVLVLGFVLLTITTTTKASKNQSIFSTNIFDAVSREVTNKNIIISPASIRTCLALTFIGAKKNTANELKKVLNLGEYAHRKNIAFEILDLLKSMDRHANATIRMANHILVNQNYSTKYRFNKIAMGYFRSSIIKINVNKKVETAKQINKRIEEQTEHKIRNVISPNVIGKDTAALLVNAIYFKAQWMNRFNAVLTSKKKFHFSKKKTKTVDMMFDQNSYFYAELKDLDAKALLLSYRGTYIRMLLLLPNKVEGLAVLKGKLKQILLTELTTKLKKSSVRVQLPKFKFEFDISLVETLKKLGLHDLFTKAADLTHLFQEKGIAISKVIHKAFIEVNEYGTEAAAATAIEITDKSGVHGAVNYEFNVDHPFVFALLDESVVYFTGQVVDV